MKRQIIQIDEEKCNGCGLCVKACHESALGIVEGKAKLLRDDYCDGMGDCLPNCPMGAISFIEKDTLPYDEAAVKANMEKNKKTSCPGSMVQVLKPTLQEELPCMPSMLKNWPIQLKLAPLQAPYYANADLLIAADCSAYAYANMHKDFMKDKVTIIACPKLDGVDYSEKLTAIIKHNTIQTITIVKMEVPCCTRLAIMAKTALDASGKSIPCKVVTISTTGKVID